MNNYDKVNKGIDKKLQGHDIKQVSHELKYERSFLFLFHIFLLGGMIWIGSIVDDTLVWFSIIGYGLLFLVSATVHKNGQSGKAMLLTLGSILIGILFLFSEFINILASAH